MARKDGWVSAKYLTETLDIDRATLFKYRDDGTLKLGSHYAAFPGVTFSRDSYLWHLQSVKKHLQKLEKAEELAVA
jgi:hypothetical protein